MHNETAVLYHGTDAEPFDRFDHSFNRTARHFYTTTDKHGAEFFGRNILAFAADMGRAIDLSDPYEPPTGSLLRQIYDEVVEPQGIYRDFDHFIEAYTDANMYQDMASSDLQDEILEEVFSMGFDPVIIPDQLGGGKIGTAVVFNDPALLTRIQAGRP